MTKLYHFKCRVAPTELLLKFVLLFKLVILLFFFLSRSNLLRAKIIDISLKLTFFFYDSFEEVLAIMNRAEQSESFRHLCLLFFCLDGFIPVGCSVPCKQLRYFPNCVLVWLANSVVHVGFEEGNKHQAMLETIKSLLGFLLESSQGEKFIQCLKLPLCLDAEAISTEFFPYPFNIHFRYYFNG